MKIYSKYNRSLSVDDFEHDFGPSLTVTNDSLSIREIFERYANGQHLSLHEYADTATDEDDEAGLMADPTREYLDMAEEQIQQNEIAEEKKKARKKAKTAPKTEEAPPDEDEVPPPDDDSK